MGLNESVVWLRFTVERMVTEDRRRYKSLSVWGSMGIHSTRFQAGAMTVSELINPDKTCNEDLVRTITKPAVSKQVLQVSVSSNSNTDHIIWPYTNEGKVTVKSAYHRMGDAE